MGHAAPGACRWALRRHMHSLGVHSQRAMPRGSIMPSCAWQTPFRPHAHAPGRIRQPGAATMCHPCYMTYHLASYEALTLPCCSTRRPARVEAGGRLDDPKNWGSPGSRPGQGQGHTGLRRTFTVWEQSEHGFKECKDFRESTEFTMLNKGRGHTKSAQQGGYVTGITHLRPLPPEPMVGVGGPSCRNLELPASPAACAAAGASWALLISLVSSGRSMT